MSSTEYYQIQASFCNYYAKVWKQYPTIHKVSVGGKKKCVAFSVYLDEPNPNIDGLGYDENCNTTGDLPSGIGTKHMLLSAFAFIRSVYAHQGVSDVYLLRDTSSIQCKGYKMNLPHYYMLHYNKTWYEKQFKAVPSTIHSSYAAAVALWKSYKETKPSATELFDCVPNQDRRRYLAQLYHKHKTLDTFIHATKDMDCSIYKTWVPILMDKFMPFIIGMELKIDASKLSLPAIEIQTLEKAPDAMFTGGWFP